MIQKPMFAAEVARLRGVSLDCFYKNRERYRLIDGMPPPMSLVGRLAWERSGMEAWLTRFHPLRPSAPANDPLPPPIASTDDEHRQRMARAYGVHRPITDLDSQRRTARG